MAIHVREVLLCLFPSAGSETLIILHLPSVCILRLCAPSFKLWQTEEGMLLLVLAHLRTNSEDSKLASTTGLRRLLSYMYSLIV